LLSRFDLLFIVLDEQTPERDRQMAQHVVRVHSYVSDSSADIIFDDPLQKNRDRDEMVRTEQFVCLFVCSFCSFSVPLRL
jgi:DNA replicative helicase MCM subunit Mcm2 (Cdc46/Mcm family)